ncbi:MULTISPECIES: iron uptake transporter permease EfeU [unclassified Vibrio]|uniref:Iron uptake transporter permease EfeU n=1 Tax=Vibrio sp. HB236076 TaxID=3232307 RepID=A0AB39HIH6_9VIBR|nr:iron uptake transporter permease EfeU [Vibrio sp. HB161653]MDP5255135.1 iron uptake transporter permease EfeU [Vibrio sp. HB161653]
MFFVPFLIMLREALEATLIVVLIASYLKQTQQTQWLKAMWFGVVLAVSGCGLLGWFIHVSSGEFPQQQQELFEGVVAVIAVALLTSMVLWMTKASRNIKTTLHNAIDQSLSRQNGQGLALVLMVFLAVAREGLESIFFLLAAFTQDVGILAPIGALTGIVAAVTIGLVLFYSSIKVPLQSFFKYSSLFILFVAAGLSASAIRAFHEAGLWNHWQSIAFNFSHYLSTHSFLGTLLEGLFGYQEAPTVSEVSVYALYLVPAMIWFYFSQSHHVDKKTSN